MLISQGCAKIFPLQSEALRIKWFTGLLPEQNLVFLLTNKFECRSFRALQRL